MVKLFTCILAVSFLAFSGSISFAETLDAKELVGLWDGMIRNDRGWSSNYYLEILQIEKPTKKVIVRQYCPNCTSRSIKFSNDWTLTDSTSRIEFTNPADSKHKEKLWVLEEPTKLTATGEYTNEPGIITVSLSKSVAKAVQPNINALKGSWKWKAKRNIELVVSNIDKEHGKFNGKLIIDGEDNAGEYECSNSAITVDGSNVNIAFTANKSRYALKFITSNSHFPEALYGVLERPNGSSGYPHFVKE